MKLACMILLFLSFKLQAVNIQEVRALYKTSVDNPKACKTLLNMLKDVDVSQPVLLGYKASATMIMANHAINPLSKLSYFKKGKRLLEEAIKKDNSNVELRFLRWMIQENIPGFLGYNKNKVEDKDFVTQQLKSIKDGQLKSFIIESTKSLNNKKI